MEFAIVTFPAVRAVIVDNAEMGQTGQILRLQRGTHTFDLATPLDYRPESQTITLTGTSFEDPREVVFTEVARARRAAKRLPARRRKAATKRSVGRKRTSKKQTSRAKRTPRTKRTMHAMRAARKNKTR
jgi:hypothetical protein